MCVVAFFLLLMAPQGWTQLTTASLAGTVKDGSGAVVPGAVITVRNVETGIVRTVESSAAGLYSVSNLPPGNYEIQTQMTGFQSEVRRGIELTVGRAAVVDFTLRVGEVQEQVVVTAEAPLVDTSSATMAGLVDQQQVEELPLNGRSLTQLTTLQPGVLLYRSVSTCTGVGENIIISGARARQINFLLNGTSTLNFFGKSPGGTSGHQLGVEGVREFTVLTSSYSAEFGRSAGGVINAVTKSGTNAFHGSVLEYLRNDNLDAAQWEDNTFNRGVQPAFTRNQFGASAGGPIRRDQTFFFLNAEFLRERLGQTLTGVFPSAKSRAGIAPDGSTFTVAAAVKPYLALLPIPDERFDLGDGYGRNVITFTRPTNQNYGNVRIDHQFNESHSVFGSYVIDDSNRFSPNSDNLTGLADTYRNQYATLQWDSILSPTMLNTAHVGFNRSLADDTPTCVDALLALSFVPGSKYCSRGGLTGMGGFFGPRIFIVNNFQYSDTLSWTRGMHTIKLGARYERHQINGESGLFPGGWMVMAPGIVNELSGRVAFFNAPLPGLNFRRGVRQNFYAFFANDSLRLLPNLTVNIGLRYEFISVPTEVNGKLSNLDSVTSPAVRIGEPYFKNPSLKNFSPRVGIAWAPRGSQTTSIRAGFGIYYDQLLHHTWIDGPFLAPPFYNEARVASSGSFQVPFPNAYDLFLAKDPRVITGGYLFFIDGNPPQPYTLQYNFTVQHQLPGQLVVQAAYVGSGGRKLARLVDNTAVPTIQSDGRVFFPTNSVRRNPNFSEIRSKQFDTNSTYNGLQLAARRRFAQGVAFQVSYTWSKVLDMMSDFNGAGDIPNDTFFGTLPELPAFDRGRAAFDARHNFVGNFTMDLPFWRSLGGAAAKVLDGWQVQSILTLQSGLSTTAWLNETFASGYTRNRSTRVAVRPDMAPGFTAESVVRGTPSQTTGNRYLDPAGFSLPEPGFLGNLGRNRIDGPGLATFDFSLIKNTGITERVNLEFRTEFFNLFNRPNYSSPARSIYRGVGADGKGILDGSFATITSTTTSARQIQLALKLSF
ncbi:MAG: TonB-dependent receptor [Acidobacteria bacterium]|nr:TonB-dependent receptor [Acidobacteriota bacterium]